jgi:hypothetical protein
MALGALAMVLVGFGRSSIARLSDGPPMTPLVYLHGSLFVGWMVFLLSQASLVAARRTAVHKRLGWVGAALAVVMIVVGAATAIAAARRGHGPVGGPLAFLTISLGDLLVFAVCVWAAVAWRAQPSVHKRLMLLGTLGGLLPAAIGRLPVVASRIPLIVLVLLLVLAAQPAFDRLTRGRMHPVSLWGGVIVFVFIPIRMALGQTDWWQTFAAWLIR